MNNGRFYLTSNPQHITLGKEFSDLKVFQVIFNFIETGWAIIPKAFDWKYWIYIY